LKRSIIKVTVIPIKLFNEEGVLSEKEFEEVKRTMSYNGTKIMKIEDLGTDPVKKWMHSYNLITVTKGNGVYDCYYGDDIIVEKLEKVGGIVIKDDDPQPVKMMKLLVAKWHKKQVVYEAEMEKMCNELVT